MCAMNQLVAACFVVTTACSSNAMQPMAGGDDDPMPMPMPGDDDPMPMPDAPPTTSLTCDTKTAQPRDSVWTLTVGGLQRTARVHVPASYDPATRTPLIINVHGRTTNASQQETVSRAIAKSDAAGFVVVHPEAHGSPTSWNAGGGCCDPALSANTDDIGFMAAIIDEAKSKLCLDEDRVFMMGLSNGGYLSYRAACELADRVAAIGSVAGLLSMPSCNPSRPVPVFQVHGTSDNIVQYAWASSTIDFFKSNNGCTTSQNTFTNGSVSCTTHGGCTANADVTMCTVQGGGHQWPGGTTIPFLGNNTNDLNATDALWTFFQAHPRAGSASP